MFVAKFVSVYTLVSLTSRLVTSGLVGHAFIDGMVLTKDDQIVDFCYPIVSCFRKIISASDANPVLVRTKNHAICIQKLSESVL